MCLYMSKNDDIVIEIITKDDPSGLKTIEIPGKTIKAFVIPRVNMAEINELENIDKPGIYFLYREEDEQIYIGQSQNVLRRLEQQKLGKEDWTVALAFTAGKEMNPLFLEKICIEEIRKIGRYKVNNLSESPGNILSKASEITNLQFIQQIIFITKLLGHSMFSEIKPAKQQGKYYLKSKNIKATGSILENNEFIVYKNSEAALQNVPTLKQYVPSSYRLRLKLIDEKILEKDEENKKYIFSKDNIFKSPSGASDAITGMSTNGWLVWKDENGKSLDENIRRVKN